MDMIGGKTSILMLWRNNQEFQAVDTTCVPVTWAAVKLGLG